MVRQIIMSVFFILVFSTCIAQNTNTSEQELILIVEKMPEYRKGINGLFDFIRQNIV